MSHHVYRTSAYVLKHEFYKDADSLVTFFTKQLGVIRALVQGSRLERSKHRYSIQPFSYCQIAVVQGKTGWRLTSIAEEGNIFYNTTTAKPIFEMIARIMKLLIRLLPGEEADTKLFDIFHEGVQVALEKNGAHKSDIENLERLIVVRLLSQLGYANVPKELQVGDGARDPDTISAETESTGTSNLYTDEALRFIDAHTTDITKSINTALRDSQL